MTRIHPGRSIKEVLAFNRDISKLQLLFECWVIKIHATKAFNPKQKSWIHVKSGEHEQGLSDYQVSIEGDVKYCYLFIFNFSDIAEWQGFLFYFFSAS